MSDREFTLLDGSSWKHTKTGFHTMPPMCRGWVPCSRERYDYALGQHGVDVAKVEAWLKRQGKCFPREPVRWFAEQMEQKLREYDASRGKRGWVDDIGPGGPEEMLEFLFERLRDEIDEVDRAMGDASTKNIIRECADVANFAMMIADIAREYQNKGADR